MYCKIVVGVFLICLSYFSKGQTNLIPNGSFEVLSSCDVGTSKISTAFPWFQPNMPATMGSSDIWNSCSNNSENGVPNNIIGYQYAQTGNSYAGIGIFFSQFDHFPIEGREYIEVELTEYLIAGKRYDVVFYVSPGTKWYNNLASNGIGVHFSIDSILNYVGGSIFLTPDIVSPPNLIISDTVNWTKIQGEYTAQGGERFITIGNFLQPEDIIFDTIGEPSNDLNCCWAYYFIDDVSVTEIDTSIGIPEPIQTNCKFYQTEDQKWVIESTGKPSKLSIYNTIGQLVYEHIPKQNKETIELSLDEGIYYWQAGVSRGKILVK